MVIVYLNLETVRFSEILELKEFFRLHPGKSPVSIEFHAQGKRVASLGIDAQRGVDEGPELQKKIQSLRSVIEL